MATKTQVVLWDDLDKIAGRDVPAARTHTLALDGRTVEIDLTERHSAALVKAVTFYLDAGQPVSAPLALGRGRGRGRAASNGGPAPGARTNPFGQTIRGPSRPGVLAYNAALRRWADAQTPPRKYRLPGGQPWYSAGLKRDFDEAGAPGYVAP